MKRLMIAVPRCLDPKLLLRQLNTCQRTVAKVRELLRNCCISFYCLVRPGNITFNSQVKIINFLFNAIYYHCQYPELKNCQICSHILLTMVNQKTERIKNFELSKFQIFVNKHLKNNSEHCKSACRSFNLTAFLRSQ